MKLLHTSPVVTEALSQTTAFTGVVSGLKEHAVFTNIQLYEKTIQQKDDFFYHATTNYFIY